MTTIEVVTDKDGAYRQIICMGHAGYADYGKDVVCAAISVEVIGTMNALQALAGEQVTETVNEESGFMKFDFSREVPLQEKSVFLLDSMIYTLENLSRQYGEKYLQVKYKEV